MTGPRFEPLLCPACAAGLAGRAEDLALFCARCGRAFLAGGAALVPVAVRVAAAPVPRDLDETELALPFWFDGHVAAPAFLSARPLTLARAATRLVPTWPLREGFGAQAPLGATLPPSSLAAVARLASLPLAAGAAPGLLAVPAAWSGTRYRLPGFAFELVPDDVQAGSPA